MIPALDFQACSASAWQATPDMALRTTVCAGLLVVAGWASARRRFPGKLSFVAMSLVMAAWIAFSIAEHAAVDAACKGTIGLVSWGVTLWQPALWALFLHRYLNAEQPLPSPWARWVLAAPVVLMWALAWSNGAHGLFYGPHTTLGPPISGLPRLHYDYGPLFYAAMGLCYFWLLLAIVLTLRGWRQTLPSQRGQWLAFLAMMSVPMAANIAYVGFGVRLYGADPTSTAFALAAAGFAWMIGHNRVFAVVPVARQRLFVELPDPLLVLDLDQRVVDANQAARALIDGEAPIGRPLAHWPQLGAALEQHLASDRASRVIELAEPRAFFVVQQRPLGAPERPIGTLVQLHDVTERELAHHDAVRALAAREVELDRATALQSLLREQAMRDPLTGLLNRRALQERYAQEQHLGPQRSLVLALLDVDHFKRINDNHGHAVGDTVLRDFAAALRSGLRAGDALFRIGGEEFALLLPETNTDTALERVESLRELVASWRLGGLHENVTFSAGLAESQVSRSSLESLLAAADKALYRAKQSGRDRIEAALAVD